MLKAHSITTLKSGHFFQIDIMRLEKGRSEKPAVVAQGAVMISAITACRRQRLCAPDEACCVLYISKWNCSKVSFFSCVLEVSGWGMHPGAK